MIKIDQILALIAELFFDLRRRWPHLVGFKEFGGAKSLSYAKRRPLEQGRP